MSTPADDLVLRFAREKGWLAPADEEPGGGPDGREPRGLVDALRWPAVDLGEVNVPAEVRALVPREIAVRHRVLPLARTGDALRIAIGDPLDTNGIDTVAHLTGLGIETVVAMPEDLAQAIERSYGATTAPDPSGPEPDPAATPGDATGAESADDAPILQLVHRLIADAVRRRASDIHVEPLERRLRVRYRIDGALVEGESLSKRLQLAVVSRLKLMANISIAEKRLPQDGRIAVTVDGRALDLRVSSLPTAHGESVVMRILDQEGLRPGLTELGFSERDRREFERLIALPDGIVLVTGPTGSGKTTTLYSCLHHLNQPDRKIITVEDPVEYQLTGVNQVPVRPEIGMTFASALRALLRQAPNVVMVGEIRDRETAEIAINASLTGHLVFSTLHTNDAPGAVTRLLDLGAKSFLVAASLRAVLAQRLVRKVCEACAKPWVPAPTELQGLGLAAAEVAGAHFRRGAGCAACGGTGFLGRVGVFELFVVDEEIERMIHEGVSAARLRERARAGGMRTMREDGVRKAIAGLTTIEEVVSITVGDAS